MREINKKQIRYLVLIIIVFSTIYFCVFVFPNNTGAEDINMLSIFEPDEFAQYPYVMRMIEFKGDSIRHALKVSTLSPSAVSVKCWLSMA